MREKKVEKRFILYSLNYFFPCHISLVSFPRSEATPSTVYVLEPLWGKDVRTLPSIFFFFCFHWDISTIISNNFIYLDFNPLKHNIIMYKKPFVNQFSKLFKLKGRLNTDTSPQNFWTTFLNNDLTEKFKKNAVANAIAIPLPLRFSCFVPVRRFRENRTKPFYFYLSHLWLSRRYSVGN